MKCFYQHKKTEGAIKLYTVILFINFKLPLKVITIYSINIFHRIFYLYINRGVIIC